MNSKAEAIKAAKQRCQKQSGTPCTVAEWTRNGCLAAALGKTKKGFILYTASDAPGHVENAALNHCKASGAQECRISMPEGCSVPEGMYK